MKSKSASTSKPVSRPSQAGLDNRANQLNPEHPAYWQSRGLPAKPEAEPVPPAQVPQTEKKG